MITLSMGILFMLPRGVQLNQNLISINVKEII